MAVRERPAAQLAEPESGPEQDLLRLRDFLEAEDVEGARAYLRQLAERWPDSERVRHYLATLQPGPARAVPGSAGRERTREIAWLRAHGQEYSGCWLVLVGDRLI